MQTSSRAFNTPFELGIRMVYLLNALHPKRADLQSLLYLDYAAIYSADVGGPQSLHTPVPLRGVEYASRRDTIEEGLYLMAKRAFIDVTATEEGVLYGIGESGPALIDLLGGPYNRTMAERCEWVASALGSRTGVELEAIFGAQGALWNAHFISKESQ